MYQFQLWHRGELHLSVDGSPVYEAAQGTRGQQFAPVMLAAGLHHLKISGRAPDPVTLRVLFGGPGSTSLDGALFRHVGG
jgi:hypothetical protein